MTQDMTPGPWLLQLKSPAITDGTCHFEIGLSPVNWDPPMLSGQRGKDYLSVSGICRPADAQVLVECPTLVMTLLDICTGDHSAEECAALAHVALQKAGVMEC